MNRKTSIKRRKTIAKIRIEETEENKDDRVSTVSMASDVFSTGKVFNAKKKAAAMDQAQEHTNKMDLKDILLPTEGVIVYEEASRLKKYQQVEKLPSSFTQGNNSQLRQTGTFQVTKRGKPFTKMASNAQMLRMTRDSYFKIAEQQGLTTMREA